MNEEQKIRKEMNALLIVSLLLIVSIITTCIMAVSTDLNYAEKLFSGEIHLAIGMILIASAIVKKRIQKEYDSEEENSEEENSEEEIL